jgi:hypothetical protein
MPSANSEANENRFFLKKTKSQFNTKAKLKNISKQKATPNPNSSLVLVEVGSTALVKSSRLSSRALQ